MVKESDEKNRALSLIFSFKQHIIQDIKLIVDKHTLKKNVTIFMKLKMFLYTIAKLFRDMKIKSQKQLKLILSCSYLVYM